MSLSSILEINQQPNDFLRGLLNLVQEFEQIPEDKFVGLSNTTASGSSSGLGFTVGGGGGGGSGGASSSGSGKGQKSLFKLSSNKSKSKSSATSSTGGGGGGIAASSGNVNSSGIISSATTGGIASSGAASGGGGADFAFGEGSESGYLFIPNIVSLTPPPPPSRVCILLKLISSRSLVCFAKKIAFRVGLPTSFNDDLRFINSGLYKDTILPRRFKCDEW